MSNDAPTTRANVPDSMTATGQHRAYHPWLMHRLIRNARMMYERMYGRAAGDNRQNAPHGHGEIGTDDGQVIRRSLVSQQYSDSSYNPYKTFSITTSWTKVGEWRTLLGPFKRAKCEILADSGGNSLWWEIRIGEATEDAACALASGWYYLTETPVATTATTWHTLTGNVYEHVSTLKASGTDLLWLPTSHWDADDVSSYGLHACASLWAKSTSGPVSMTMYNAHLWEALTTD